MTVKINLIRDFKIPEMGPIVSIELNPVDWASFAGTFIVAQ